MSDLISRSDAIGAVKEERFPIDSDYAEGFMAALDKVEWILKEWLPSAQPDSKELSFTHKALDTISRQDAIRIVDGIDTWQAGWRGDAIESMKALPSAQPETHEERTETHSCDCISRQAAMEEISKQQTYKMFEGEDTLYLDANDVGSVLASLPSAQPEPCVDTIDALDESIKHFDDMAEECRRNANIEQNDYMDMRDDAAEYRQLSIWLNELKWLRERFQSQPDLSEYSDKLWKAAYERGKAEAQQRWIPCSERLPDEYGEYRITWVTSLVPSKRFIGDSEYEVTSVWDEERKGFKGEWLLDDYIKHYPDVKVIAWKPLEEPYQAERRTDGV